MGKDDHSIVPPRPSIQEGFNGVTDDAVLPYFVVVERVERRSHPHETPAGALAVDGPGL